MAKPVPVYNITEWPHDTGNKAERRPLTKQEEAQLEKLGAAYLRVSQVENERVSELQDRIRETTVQGEIPSASYILETPTGKIEYTFSRLESLADQEELPATIEPLIANDVYRTMIAKRVGDEYVALPDTKTVRLR